MRWRCALYIWKSLNYLFIQVDKWIVSPIVIATVLVICLHHDILPLSLYTTTIQLNYYEIAVTPYLLGNKRFYKSKFCHNTTDHTRQSWSDPVVFRLISGLDTNNKMTCGKSDVIQQHNTRSYSFILLVRLTFQCMLEIWDRASDNEQLWFKRFQRIWVLQTLCSSSGNAINVHIRDFILRVRFIDVF